jgi:RNA polymerase sigma factor (sigma-70 family)
MNTNVLEGFPTEKLTPEREQELATNKSDEGVAELILHNMPEAFIYARACSQRMLPDREVLSLCYTALSNAARNFKPGFQRFFPYAKAFVRGQINREWEKKDVVRNTGGQVSLDALPGVEAAGLVGRTDFSDSCQFKAPIHDVPEHESPETENIFTREMMDIIRPIIARKLSRQKQLILEMAYFQDLNFQEIANLLGVSRAAIQASHVSAIAKLRKGLLTSRKVI